MNEYPGIGQILKIAEVAQILKISRTSAYRLIETGDLPHVRFGEATVRVRACDLSDYINSRVMNAAQAAPAPLCPPNMAENAKLEGG